MSASTKDRIADTFLALTEQKAGNKITVREIAANCAITTVTFYNHFRDKYDLIVWSYIDYGKSTMQKIGTDGYRWCDTLFEAMRDFAEKRAFLLNALHHTSGHDSFVSHMERINIDLLTAEVKKSLGTKPLTAELDYAIRIYCYGTVRLVFDWLTSEKSISPDDIARIKDTEFSPFRKDNFCAHKKIFRKTP